MSDLVSIVIVNWNGQTWLKKCLDSLRQQTYPNREIIFVDNASVDGSVKFVKENYPEVQIVQSEINRGFAGGNNLGIAQAHGEYVMLLNNDTWVEADFVEKMMDGLARNDLDVIGPQEADYESARVYTHRIQIDSFGHPINVSEHEAGGNDFFLSGVCLLFKKKIYEETGGLDNDFFMYFEETDWFWRLHLLKKKTGRLDGVRVCHAGSGSTGTGVKYNTFLWRNQNELQMLLKNYGIISLLWALPVYFFQNLAEIFLFLVLLKPRISLSYVQGWWYNIAHIKRTIEKRRWVQKQRMIKDEEIRKKMYHGLGKLRHLITFIKR